MAIASNSQLHFPTHSELRAIPVATWVYAAVGVVALVVAVASTFSLSVTSLLGSVEFVAPAFFAAAIAFVAPRDRLAQIAALCFAVPVAVSALTISFSLGFLRAIGSDSRDWSQLVPTLDQWLGALSSVGWLLGLVAVVALSLYIGRIRSRLGWLLLAAGIGLAVLRVVLAYNAVNDLLLQVDLAPSDLPVQMFLSPLAGLAGVGWALLLAIAWERRLWLLTLAAVTQVALALLSSLTDYVFADWFQAASQADSLGYEAWLFVFVAIGLTFTVAMLLGILRELPRHGRTTDAAVAATQ